MSLHVHSMSVSICQFCPIPGKLDKILFYLSMEYFAQFDTTKDFFFVVIEEKKKGRRDGEKNLRLLLRLSSSFTTLNCKVDFYSLGDQDEEANRTCHLCA